MCVLDGGVVRLPGGSGLSFRLDLEEGHVYACMAETILLALEHRYSDASLGLDLDMRQLDEIEGFAARHGFHVVGFRDRATSNPQVCHYSSPRIWLKSRIENPPTPLVSPLVRFLPTGRGAAPCQPEKANRERAVAQWVSSRQDTGSDFTLISLQRQRIITPRGLQRSNYANVPLKLAPWKAMLWRYVDCRVNGDSI